MAKRRTEQIELDRSFKPHKVESVQQQPTLEVFDPSGEILSADSQQGVNIRTLENDVGECLKIIDDKVMHSYVTKLSELPIVAPHFDEEQMRKEPYQFIQITKLVYEQNEFSVSKLSTIFQALSGKNCTLVLMVQNVDRITNFYLGVRDHKEKGFTGTLRQMLEMSLKGQFPGSSLNTGFSIEDMHEITEGLKSSLKAVSCVSCVPDFKQGNDQLENKDFMQGLEKFIISMQDKDYTAVFVADAVKYDELVAKRINLEYVCTQLSPFANMQYQISTSDSKSNSAMHQSGQSTTSSAGTSDSVGTSKSVSTAKTESTAFTEGNTQTHGTNTGVTDTESSGESSTEGTSNSVSDGITKTNTVTVGASQTVGSTTTVGTYGGVSVDGGVPFLKGGVNAGVTASEAINVSGSLNESYSHSTAKSHSVTSGVSHSETLSKNVSKALSSSTSDSLAQSSSTTKSAGTSVSNTTGETSQHGTNSSYSETFSFGQADTITDTFGTSKGISIQSQNMMIINMTDRIKKQISRISECESIGMWNCAAYFISGSRAISETAASTYHSLISGKNSGVERSAVNTWTDGENLSALYEYITHFCHPQFEYNSSDGLCTVSPASLISTKELAIAMSLPRKSVCGLPVIEHAIFGQQIIRNDIADCHTDNDKIYLGDVFHLNSRTPIPVQLDLRSLTMHTFITGSTGSGKSNTVYHILDELSQRKIPYLVVEPAKGEYRTKFTDACVYGTNPNNGEMLRLNPFAFPKEIHIQEHIDRLAELFNVCWEMYAAMPAVLKDAIIRAYESAGWDMNRSINTINDDLFPTFEDVLREIDTVIRESDYSGDTGSDYRGALKARLSSLTNGINGMIFSSREIPNEKLFDSKTIVDLSRVGSIETKSLMMGILVLKLQEYRMSDHKETDSDLRHITILEEAHNLLKKTSMEQGQETANIQGKSVEMLTNAVAEMRTYGEGFVIVDQAPDLLDPAVIRNTNTKIVMRLPEDKDREITGLSMALNENQVKELSKLPQGVAAVYQNNWQESVLCVMPKFTAVNYPAYAVAKENDYDERQTLQLLLDSDSMCPSLLNAIVLSDAPAKVRKELIQNYDNNNIVFEWAMADYINSRFNWKNIFSGTNKSCDTIEELGGIMLSNVKTIFPGFSDDEIGKICYYVCRKAHELYPENEEIENVRVNFFKRGRVYG